MKFQSTESNAPSLEVFVARLDGALSNFMWLKISLFLAEGLELAGIWRSFLTQASCDSTITGFSASILSWSLKWSQCLTDGAVAEAGWVQAGPWGLPATCPFPAPTTVLKEEQSQGRVPCPAHWWQSSWLHNLKHFYIYFYQTLQCGYNIEPPAENFPPTWLLWFRNGTPLFSVSTETLQFSPPFVAGWRELEAQMVKIAGWGKSNLMKIAMG